MQLLQQRARRDSPRCLASPPPCSGVRAAIWAQWAAIWAQWDLCTPKCISSPYRAMRSENAAGVDDPSILKNRTAISYDPDGERKLQDSFENVIENLGPRRIHWALASACLLINLIPSVGGGMMPYIKASVMLEYGVSNTQVAWRGGGSSGSVFSSVVGSAVFGRMADSFGRTPWAALPPVLACVALSLPLVLLQLACRGPLGFRLLVALQTLLGLPTAGLSAVVVPYMLEFCSSSTRGVMGTMINLGWPLGAIYSVLVVRAVGTDNWRLCLLAPVPPCILALCCLPLLPESPRWLSAVGRHKEAQQVLRLMSASGALGGGAPAPAASQAETLPLLPEAAACAESPREPGLPPYRELASPAFRSDILTVCALFACAGCESFAFWVFGPELLKGASGQEPPYWIFIMYLKASGLSLPPPVALAKPAWFTHAEV
ncbi:unnamed protein product [Prorocentrum cordatum]|uniref:Major facilitator superfamily (MFS) profile domain-containing protein n=1 Tax=Prorocentrum cordatum TaxID=2364126 RepID=A0ABN9S101_9DINO|nr:unnamed protein product [Polarella glacialis]